MLIVIDNAWKIEHVLACMLGGSTCAYLITTRLLDVATHFAREQAILVEELNEDDAFLLLRRLVPAAMSTDEEGAKKLMRNVGGLPLAITLIGGYLRRQTRYRQRRRIQAALDHLQDMKRRLEIEEPQGRVGSILPVELPSHSSMSRIPLFCPLRLLVGVEKVVGEASFLFHEGADWSPRRISSAPVALPKAARPATPAAQERVRNSLFPTPEAG